MRHQLRLQDHSRASTFSRMSGFWATIFLCFIFNILAEAGNEKQHASAVVVGTVYCDTCFQQDFSKTSHFISGASIAVECGDMKRTNFRQEVKTNERGEFRVHLPFSVSKHVSKIKECSVKLISSSEPFCAVASTATSSSLHLKSKKEGTHIFSAGFFTFKPLKQPELCNQKPSTQNSEKLSGEKSLISNPNDPTFVPPIQDPPTSYLPPIGQDFLPPLPQLPPLTRLPPLPTLPGIPQFPPVPKKPASEASTKASRFSDKKVAEPRFFNPIGIPLPPNPFNPPSIFPPNPFQPPPSVLPPIFPSPPPSVFPPLFPSPPPSPLIHFPPIPGFTPSPPPPPPAFPFPLPPFPFQPTPGFPGVPPPATPASTKKNAP